MQLTARDDRQRQIEAELAAQYAEPESKEVQRGMKDWRHIRRAVARRALSGT